MLKNVIEDFLKSTTEPNFYVIFPSILHALGFSDVHFTHGITEYGKDFIAKKNDCQYCFQLKAGDINLGDFREIKLQLLDAYTNRISYPCCDDKLEFRVVLVTTGIVKSVCDVDFKAFNQYLTEQLRETPIEIWDYYHLLKIMYNDEFDQYFSSYLDNQEIASFLKILSSIKEQNYNWYEFERYTVKWLADDDKARFRPFIEAGIFAKFLKENNDDYYLAMLYVCLFRFCQVKHLGDAYQATLRNELKNICQSYAERLTNLRQRQEKFNCTLKLPNPFFDYPRYCLQTAEIIAVGILLDLLPVTEIDNLEYMIVSEKGMCYIISDNYAVTVYLITRALLKCGKGELLKKYLTNTAIWVCDRIADYGTAQIPSNEVEEAAQILATYLTCFDVPRRKASFTATVLLYCVFLTGDPSLLKSCINEFKAVDTILEYHNVLDNESVWRYDAKEITDSNDPEYTEKAGFDYSNGLKYLIENSTVSVSEENKNLSAWLLRERFYPQASI